MVFLSSTIVAGSFVLQVGRVLDPALKRNVETIYLFKFIFKFVYQSYLLLNLRQMIYEFSLKYFKSYFVTMLIKLRCNKQNISGSVQISIVNTRLCKFLRFLPTLNNFYIHTYILCKIESSPPLRASPSEVFQKQSKNASFGRFIDFEWFNCRYFIVPMGTMDRFSHLSLN